MASSSPRQAVRRARELGGAMADEGSRLRATLVEVGKRPPCGRTHSSKNGAELRRQTTGLAAPSPKPASPAPACVCTRRSCRRTCFRAAWLRRRRAAASGRGGGKLARPAGCLGRGLELGAAWPIGHGRARRAVMAAASSGFKTERQSIRRGGAPASHCCDDQGVDGS